GVPSGGVAPASESCRSGSSTTSAGSWESLVTAGRLDGLAAARDSASGGNWDHRRRVASGTEQGSRDGAGRRTVAHGLHPVDQDPDDAVGSGEEARGLAGEVVDQA